MNKTVPPESLVEPTFEVGKSYRTRKGDVVKIERIRTHGCYPLQGPSHIQCWTLDGRYWRHAKGECSADLMPGAVEDEPEAVEVEPEPNDPIPVLVREISMANQRINELEAVITDLAKDRREHENRLDRHETNLASHGERIDSQRYVLIDHTNHLDRLEKAGDHHLNFINMQRKRIEALEEQMTAALGITLSARPRPATPVEQAVNALNDRLEPIENILVGQGWDIGRPKTELFPDRKPTGLDVRSAKPKSVFEELAAVMDGKPTCGHPECGQCYPTPTKPTIKGGWVNVYWNDLHQRASTGDFHNTREKADQAPHEGRIACIQIPDIQEGEGL